jgi:hypothetical protein
MLTGQFRMHLPQPTQKEMPKFSTEYRNLCMIRCRQRSLGVGRGLCPEACKVNWGNAQQSQVLTRRPEAFLTSSVMSKQ